MPVPQERRTGMQKTLKNGAGKVHRRLDLAKAYVRSVYGGYKDEDLFADVETFCMFIGYPKSGHSLVGSLLDAHPNAIIAHELDALRYVRARFGRRQLYHLLLENSREYGETGRNWNVYSYRVPGQWQGRYEKLRVIGDKKGGLSTMRLDSDPDLLGKLRKTVGVPVKFVHIIRNPYDNISTMLRDGIYNYWSMKGRRRGLRYSIEDYFFRCAAVRDFKEKTDPADVFEVRHESVVEDPALRLRELCRFLGLGCTDDYLRACASMVFKSPSKSRHKVKWDQESIRIVRNRMEEFDFLRGYSYEE